MDRRKHMKKKHTRIVTFNVHFGKKAKSIAEAFKRNEKLRGADIIFLQEIEEYKNEEVPRVKTIADSLEMEYIYTPARPILTKGTHGLAILSKKAPTEVEIVPLPA